MFTSTSPLAPTAALVIPISYFSDRVGIDWLGRNDAHIAHEPMHRPSSGLRTLVEFQRAI